jgi:hypothetical protein
VLKNDHIEPKATKSAAAETGVMGILDTIQ